MRGKSVPCGKCTLRSMAAWRHGGPVLLRGLGYRRGKLVLKGPHARGATVGRKQKGVALKKSSVKGVV